MIETTAPAETPAASAASAETPAAPAETPAAPAETPAAPAETPAAAPIALLPQVGGAPPQPRRKITWKGADGVAANEHVTVLKLG